MSIRNIILVLLIAAFPAGAGAQTNDPVDPLESLKGLADEECGFHRQARDEACDSQPGSPACRAYQEIFEQNCARKTERVLTASDKSAIMQASRERCERDGDTAWLDCACEAELVRKDLLLGGVGEVGFPRSCVNEAGIRRWGVVRCESTFARVVDDDYCACFGEQAAEYVRDFDDGVRPPEDPILERAAEQCKSLLADSTQLEVEQREELRTYSRTEIRNLYDACMRSLYAPRTDEQICRTYCSVVPERCDNPTLGEFL